nr:SMC-Scp complex subunit ScpB [Legionella sainthelensi]
MLSSNEPLSVERLLDTFDEWQRPSKEHLITVINELKEDYSLRSFELVQVATGFRIQTKKEYSNWGSEITNRKTNKVIHVLCLKH